MPFYAIGWYMPVYGGVGGRHTEDIYICVGDILGDSTHVCYCEGEGRRRKTMVILSFCLGGWRAGRGSLLFLVSVSFLPSLYGEVKVGELPAQGSDAWATDTQHLSHATQPACRWCRSQTGGNSAQVVYPQEGRCVLG